MWIFLAIIAFLAAVVTVILTLPIYIIIKSDENGELILRYRFLFKTYGEDPDPNAPLVKILKKGGGIERLEKEKLKSSIESSGLLQTISESYFVLVELLKEIAALLQYCTAKRFHIFIRCADSDPAEAAMRYGTACALTHSALVALSAIVKIPLKKQKIDIGCDFVATQDVFRYDVLLVVSLGHALAAFLRAAYREAQRQQTENQSQEK